MASSTGLRGCRDDLGRPCDEKFAKLGFIFSLIATALYAIVYIVILANPSISFPLNPIMIIFLLILAPLIVAFAVIGIIVLAMLAVGIILIGAGKTKAGGIIVIVASCVGLFFAMIAYFVPLGLGIAGGVLAIKNL